MSTEFEILERLITTRRSIRRYQDKLVPEELLMKAVELASWAPSSGGKQGWHFTVVTNRDRIGAVAEAVQDVTEMMATWPESEATDVKSSIERWRITSAFFRDAPALIAVSMADYVSVTDRLTGSRMTFDPQAAAIVTARQLGASRLQTVAGATAMLILVLHAMGLGTVWMAGPQQAKARVEQLLLIPEDFDFVALVPVGYPAEEPVPPSRKPLQEMTTVIR